MKLLWPSALLAMLALLFAQQGVADQLAGYWKHEEEPGWLEIRFTGGTGTATVVRNDLHPEREGREILKDLVADGSSYRATAYAWRLKEYREIQVAQPSPDIMTFVIKVGFISHEVNWMRVDEVPARAGSQ